MSYGPVPTAHGVRVVNDFPARVRALRESRGLTATQLAAAIGLTEQAVNKWERGRKRPTDVATVTRLAAVLAVTFDDLTQERAS